MRLAAYYTSCIIIGSHRQKSWFDTFDDSTAVIQLRFWASKM